MALEEYRKKRNFQQTGEPSGEETPERGRDGERLFVIQKHDASRLHYDVRLEHDGVLLSWAVPKGPSLDPDERRLAVHVEDHPLEYADFEGVIPEDEYGGGTVLLWDRGGWKPEGDPDEGLRNGKLSFTLKGEKLRGRWTLVRMDGAAGENGDRNWLLIHSGDDPSGSSAGDRDPVEARPESVATGRTLDEVAEDRNRVWSATEEGISERTGPHDTGLPDPGGLAGAEPGPLPERPKPELATRVAEPPAGEGWIHEVKFDGYRILAVHRGDEVALLTRGGNDWTPRFPRVAAAVTSLPVDDAVLDGEVVFLRPDGTTSFQELQRVLGSGETNARITYYTFDLLHLDGYDVRAVRLLERKRALRDVLRSSGALAEEEATDGGRGPLRYSDHIQGEGPGFLHQACRLALEGAVSKLASSRYREGRTRDWRKSKCVERQEFVVVGFTDPSGARSGFGSLLLGYHRPDGSLAYAGRVGTGFTAGMLDDLSEILEEIERKDRPFSAGEADAERGRDIHWVEPRLVVEVEFTEWTRDGVLRHPSFKGVREDVQPNEVRREMASKESGTADDHERASSTRGGRSRGSSRKKTTEMEGVRLTHPDRVLYPEQGVTKRKLAEYYRDVGDRMLEHAAHRPLTLVRCPKGQGEKCFYQKHTNESVPDVVETVEIEESEGRGRYLVLDGVASLIALVQIGTLEIHPWGSRTDRLERPDRIVFDLDPGPGVDWSRVMEAARTLRHRLGGMGLESFVKTTGGKGLHVEVPIVRRNRWDEVKAFARAMATEMASTAPDRYVAKASKAERRGRIYVDYLRNSRGATAVAPYSSRARPGAPVAVPIRWDELGSGLDPSRYTVDTVLRRLTALDADPWDGFSGVRQSITHPMRKSLGIEGSR